MRRGRSPACAAPTASRSAPCSAAESPSSAEVGLGLALAVVRNLLDGPAVPVRFAEVDEPAPGEVLDLGDLESALGELLACGVGVLDHHLQALERAGLHLGDTGPDRDRAVGPGRGELDEAQLLVDLDVVVGVESGLLVEGLRAVDVGDGDGDQFELEVHRAGTLASS